MIYKILVTKAEARQLTGLTIADINHYVETNTWPTILSGRRRLIPVEVIEAWIDAQIGLESSRP